MVTDTKPTFSDTLELDLSDVVPSIAGPKRPQDRVSLTESKQAFRLALEGYLPEENRSFRALYPLIYRNGSQFTHPSTHALASRPRCGSTRYALAMNPGSNGSEICHRSAEGSKTTT